MVNKVDVERAISVLAKTGKFVFGKKEVKQMIDEKKAKMVVFSQHYDEELLKKCKASEIKCIVYKKNPIELGIICGKPFSVSALAVEDEGASNILSIKEKEG